MVNNFRLFALLLAKERYLMFRRSPRNPLRYHPVFSTAHYFPSLPLPSPTCARPSDITPRRELAPLARMRGCRARLQAASPRRRSIPPNDISESISNGIFRVPKRQENHGLETSSLPTENPPPM
ncbi:hypothetical protein TNCV_1799981 [Trichonephila clavipes]|nr:hypothetical protein TNCV_1799981 [Trichonephila clavipes]